MRLFRRRVRGPSARRTWGSQRALVRSMRDYARRETEEDLREAVMVGLNRSVVHMPVYDTVRRRHAYRARTRSTRTRSAGHRLRAAWVFDCEWSRLGALQSEARARRWGPIAGAIAARHGDADVDAEDDDDRVCAGPCSSRPSPGGPSPIEFLFERVTSTGSVDRSRGDGPGPLARPVSWERRMGQRWRGGWCV